MKITINLNIPDKETKYIEAMKKAKGLKVAAFGEGNPWGLDFKVEEVVEKVNPQYLPLQSQGFCGHNIAPSCVGREEVSYNTVINGVTYVDSYESFGCPECDLEHMKNFEKRAKEHYEKHKPKRDVEYRIEARGV